MERKGKQILKVALCCLVLAWMLAAGEKVQAETEQEIGSTILGTYGDNITWKLEDGVLTVCGKGDMKNCGHNKMHVFEWSEIDCYPRGIYGWEPYREEIRDVVVEEGITSISAHAFSRMENAQTISLPSTLKRIEHAAFYASGFRRIVFPDKVTSIGKKAFSDCRKLKNVKWEENCCLREIKELGFGNSGLETFFIPASIESLNYNALAGIEAIKVDKKNEAYKVKDGVLFSKDGKTLVYYPKNKKGSTYKIPKGVKTIGRYAFNENQYLKKVIMPDSVTVVKAEAFYGMKKLKKVVFSKNLTRLESCAILGCGLKSLKLSDSLCYIGYSALDVRYIKGEIIIPKNVQVLRRCALFRANSSQKIVIKSKKLKKVSEDAINADEKVKVYLPLSKKERYKKFFSKDRRGKKVTVVYE